jgi:hypothetical protein
MTDKSLLRFDEPGLVYQNGVLELVADQDLYDVQCDACLRWDVGGMAVIPRPMTGGEIRAMAFLFLNSSL